jgi:hypothetical protein
MFTILTILPESSLHRQDVRLLESHRAKLCLGHAFDNFSTIARHLKLVFKLNSIPILIAYANPSFLFSFLQPILLSYSRHKIIINYKFHLCRAVILHLSHHNKEFNSDSYIPEPTEIAGCKYALANTSVTLQNLPFAPPLEL